MVVGGDYMGLGIVRSLACFGVPTCVIDDERSIARFSRYAGASIRVANLRDERQTIESVLAAGEELGLDGWVLYPTRDETVAAFSRHRSTLSRRFRVPTPDWSVVQWAWDKRNTYAMAEKLGIPIPRTSYLTEAAELDGLPGRYPLVIKPAIKERFLYATKAKAWRVDDPAELRRLVSRATEFIDHREVMVQEMIPGGGLEQFAYCAFFTAGRPLASMVVRRRRQHPPDFGRASTFVETIDLPEIERSSEEFLRAIDYYGLVEMEYKFDRRDGEYKLLDVNARTWGYHTVGLTAGVNFPYLLYCDQVGLPVEACRAGAGVSWVRFLTDLPTGLVEIRRGSLGWRPFLQSITHADVEAVFDRHDPIPFLREIALLPYLAVKRGF